MNPIYNEWISEAIERGDFVHVNDNVFLRLNSIGGLTLIAELKARWVHNGLIKETAMPNEDDDDIQQYVAQRKWVGLHLDDIPETFVGDWSFLEGARWAEAKLKEKNGG